MLWSWPFLSRVKERLYTLALHAGGHLVQLDVLDAYVGRDDLFLGTLIPLETVEGGAALVLALQFLHSVQGLQEIGHFLVAVGASPPQRPGTQGGA